jgi:imidazolonepropionase-like amidohydrolase
LAVVTASARGADQVPGPAQNHPVVLVGGTVHPVSGPAIEDGVVVFEKGKIVAVGTGLKAPAGAQTISITGKHVYPGLIDAYTDMGLIEVNSLRASRDYSETGRINPNVKSWVAVNPDSELIPVARANGVLAVLTAPRGGLIGGMSAVMAMDGWTYEDMTVHAPAGLHVTWPAMSRGQDAALREIEQTFEDARAYLKARRAGADEASAPDAQPLNGWASDDAVDAKWEAMVDVLEGRVPVIVDASTLSEIQSAVAFAQRQGVRIIISGGYDAAHCAELLKAHNVPVIIAGTHNLPMRRHQAYDDPYTLAARLHAAGVKFCISGHYRFGASMVRNLPYHAATAAAYGLPRDEALKAITLYPAQILGAAGRLGSIEVGRDATLIVTDGDPLEISTHVEQAWIGGRPVDLSSRHTDLWAKYREKYRRLNADSE